MDIHRCRFVPYPPSAINVLAFSHDHTKRGKSTNVRLAIGRANGDIEIWNPLNGAWLQELVIRGGKDRSIDGLVWTQDPDEEINGQLIRGKLRLFSIGYTTTVTEWNLSTGEPLRQRSGNHGEIWCMAAQPALSSKQSKVATGWSGQNLVTGCTDGGVILYSTEDDDLKLQRIIARPSVKKAKIISIVFQNRNVVVAGCTDSTIRLFDASKGTNIRNMSLGSGPSGGPKEIIIWVIKCLPNGNIVSGDSTGELRIWDGKTHTLMQRVKSHKQDVLSLATSYDGTTIFSGGMDRRTVVYKLSGGGRSRWAKTSHQRTHEHDVKTMATFEDHSMSVVASGGVDTTPIITPLREFGLENQRKLQFLPQHPPITSAPAKRLVMSYWDREVCIWRINKPSKAGPETDDSESESEFQTRKLVARILVKGEASITSATITKDGTLLAISTTSEIKIFQLKQRKSIDRDALKVSKVAVPFSFTSAGARLVEFSPDGKWLCIIRSDSRVLVARIQSSPEPSPIIFNCLTKLERLDRKIGKVALLGGLGDYNRTITRTAFSSDSRILAVSDLAGFIDTWILEGTEDQTQEFVDDIDDNESDSSSDNESDATSDAGEDEKVKGKIIFGQRWILNPSASLVPHLPSTPVVLSFRPASVFSAESKTSKSLSNGSSIPHPTRHTPNPVSHTLDSLLTEDRLLVVTATTHVFEFEILKGSLSSWSRRNPMERFPVAFSNIRDLAMGAIWDVTAARERIWLYGVSWLWMFDLSTDFPPTSLQNGTTTSMQKEDKAIIKKEQSERKDKKRKRAIDDERQCALRVKNVKKGTSGAGSRVPDEELGLGIGRKFLKIQYDEDAGGKEQSRVESHCIKRPALHIPSEDEDSGDAENEEEDGDIEMGGIHREINGSSEELPDPRTDTNVDDTALVKHEKNEQADRDGKKGWWSTFKYRPIMGIVPISNDMDEMEVVLVERPVWEVDLPPRFYGDWEKPGL